MTSVVSMHLVFMHARSWSTVFFILCIVLSLSPAAGFSGYTHPLLLWTNTEIRSPPASSADQRTLLLPSLCSISGLRHQWRVAPRILAGGERSWTMESQNGGIESEAERERRRVARVFSSPAQYAPAVNLSEEEVKERKAKQEAASLALHRMLQDPSIPSEEKQQLKCAHRFKHGRHPFVCNRCWSYLPVCVCPLTPSPFALPPGSCSPPIVLRIRCAISGVDASDAAYRLGSCCLGAPKGVGSH
eukprot:2383708-Rhodomonas_salina.2